ncbi:MAG: PilZ domain-containing protein [Syntrophotaleaceae bacterium]
MTQVLILADNSKTRLALESALKTIGMRFETVNSVLEMRRRLQIKAFSGTILDVLKAVRATPSEKAILQEISDFYPTLRLRWDSSGQCFRGLLLGHSLDREDPLGHFLEQFCLPNPGRTFRESKRITAHFCALLSPDENFFDDRTEKTVTRDISLGGCFLFSVGNWNMTERAWVRFIHFSEPSPYQVQIQNVIPWGSRDSFPGIGVKFIDLNSSQLNELCRKLNLP